MPRASNLNVALDNFQLKLKANGQAIIYCVSSRISLQHLSDYRDISQFFEGLEDYHKINFVKLKSNFSLLLIGSHNF